MRKFSAEVFMPIGAEATPPRLKAVLEGLERAKEPTVLDERTVFVRTGVSWRSWGERVTCTIQPVESGFLIYVESRSSVTTTLIDYGVNRRNVEQVVRALQGVKGN